MFNLLVNKQIMKYLLANHAEVLSIAVDYTKTIGEISELDNAIREGDVEYLVKLEETNAPLLRAILEAEY